MSTRPRLVRSVVVVASIALGTSACNQTKLDSGSQGLAVAYTPAPAGSGRFEAAHFYINKVQVLPIDPNTAEVYRSVALLLRLKAFPSAGDLDGGVDIDTAGILTMTHPYVLADIALPAGTYKVTRLEVTHPNLVDDQVSTPVPTDQEHCMDGVSSINAEGIGAPSPVIFDDTAGFTFSIQPGQSTLAIKLDIPSFLQAYEATFSCQIGCGVNDPNRNCIIAPYHEAAYRTAVQTYLRFE